MSETTEKAPMPAGRPMKSPADSEAGQPGEQGLRFKSKFNDAEYERWRKAADAKRDCKGAR